MSTFQSRGSCDLFDFTNSAEQPCAASGTRSSGTCVTRVLENSIREPVPEFVLPGTDRNDADRIIGIPIMFLRYHYDCINSCMMPYH